MLDKISKTPMASSLQMIKIPTSVAGEREASTPPNITWERRMVGSEIRRMQVFQGVDTPCKMGSLPVTSRGP